MVITIKDSLKLIGVVLTVLCAALVCNMFINYYFDLVAVRSSLVSVGEIALYNAQVATAKVVVGVSGGCLALTSVIEIAFYIRQYIDKKSKDLGILKAIGYSDVKIAIRFAVFGLSVLVGSIIGFALSYAIMPSFYVAQSKDFIDVPFNFHFITPIILIVLPTLVFTAFSVGYAFVKIKSPVLQLLRGKNTYKVKASKYGYKQKPFLKDMKRAILSSRKILAVLIAFSGFCFSAMMQMSISMLDVGAMFAIMILVIGLILAFTTLFMSVTAVVNRNISALALMRAMGYTQKDCYSAVFGVYRPIAYIGFAIGTLYQYGLLKIMFNIVFKDIGAVPHYSFDIKAFVITIISFAAVFELIMYCYSLKARRAPLKTFMTE